MNYVTRFQLPARSDRGSSHRNAADLVALLLDDVATLSANRSRHAAAVLQIVVGRIDDRIGVHLRQIALHDDYPRSDGGAARRLLNHSPMLSCRWPSRIRILPAPISAPAARPSRIARATGTAGTFRRASCEDIPEYSASRRVPPGPQARTVPWDDSGRASGPCRCPLRLRSLPATCKTPHSRSSR